MRVIAGRAKGRPLKAPKGATTRPTSDKVRGAIFAMVESLLEAGRASAAEEAAESAWAGQRVLDLYAGSGALGIEALSRGADWADFVESKAAACETIRSNLARTGLAAFGRVHCGTAQHFLGRAERGKIGYDLVLMDPPYADPQIEAELVTLGKSGIVKEGGWLVVEHARGRELPGHAPGLVRIKVRHHGDTGISIYSRRRIEDVAVAVSGDGPGE